MSSTCRVGLTQDSHHFAHEKHLQSESEMRTAYNGAMEYDVRCDAVKQTVVATATGPVDQRWGEGEYGQGEKRGFAYCSKAHWTGG